MAEEMTLGENWESDEAEDWESDESIVEDIGERRRRQWRRQPVRGKALQMRGPNGKVLRSTQKFATAKETQSGLDAIENRLDRVQTTSVTKDNTIQGGVTVFIVGSLLVLALVEVSRQKSGITLADLSDNALAKGAAVGAAAHLATTATKAAVYNGYRATYMGTFGDIFSGGVLAAFGVGRLQLQNQPPVPPSDILSFPTFGDLNHALPTLKESQTVITSDDGQGYRIFVDTNKVNVPMRIET